MKSDVVVIGGGAMGSSVAYHLKSDPSFSGTVTWSGATRLMRASSALVGSSIRQQFSTPLNIHLSRLGIGLLRRARVMLGVDLGLREPGYSFSASPAGEAVLRANHAIQKGEGCSVELLDPAALQARFPWISTDSLAFASLGTANEGWFRRAVLLMQGLGARRVILARPTSPTRSSRSIAAGSLWRTADGRPDAGRVVLAAGPWSGEVAGRSGIALPVEPRRRSVFVFVSARRQGLTPLTIDPSGTWFRPEGRFLVGGDAGGGQRSGRCAARGAAEEWDEILRPTPARACRPRRGGEGSRLLGGLLRVQHVRPERHRRAVIWRSRSLIFVTGFSGHGIQQSPAIGRAVAETDRAWQLSNTRPRQSFWL